MPATRSSRRARGAHHPETTPRHVWLAGLGLVAVARREASAAIDRFVSEAADARDRGLRLACDARDIARGAAITVGEKFEARFGRPGTGRRPVRKAAGTPRGATARGRRTARKPAARRRG